MSSARDRTRALLRLIHDFSQRSEWVSTATTSRTHAGKLLRGQPGFPQRMTDGEVFDRLLQAELRGWLARESYKGADRKERERWQVTGQGFEEFGIGSNESLKSQITGDEGSIEMFAVAMAEAAYQAVKRAAAEYQPC